MPWGPWMSDHPADEPGIYLSRDDLRGRGWTPGLMRSFLPISESSRRCTTSTSKRIPLWDRDIIEKIERSCSFMSAVSALQQAHSTRHSRMHDEVQRKAEREKIKAIAAIEAARLWPIHVEVCTNVRILRLAIDEYIERSSSCGKFRDRLTLRSDPTLLDEIVQSFAVHRITNFDEAVRRYIQNHKSADGLDVLKRGFADKIEEAYGEFGGTVEGMVE